MSVLDVSWEEYHRLVERLALQVYESGWTFNQITCIARGGLRVGDVLSRIFEVPLAIVHTKSYTEADGTIQGALTVGEHMMMDSSQLGDRVLLVDDLVDSGRTLAVVARMLPERFPYVSEMRSAVLWYKGCSAFKPDYYVEFLPESPWIKQPFEEYDHLRPDQLAARRNQTKPS